ncbi:amphi-Trp domain-containing protein [Haladaptatus salinisoli]|uniref:amphi-Trp domain-containing protein n=1 Tax=Haladaptatus salinisoli TaxID=2884876 RepID=UPI001D0A1659|nr:amphi-Trp domain-containing protein [Haladaptatus salinisoli]
MSEISAERERSRAEVADYLRQFADKLDGGDGSDRGDGRPEPDIGSDENADSERSTGEKVTFMVGNDSATVNPPETVSFVVEVNSDSSLVSPDETQRVGFELRWDADEIPEDDELSIE